MQTNDISNIMKLCEKHGLTFFKYVSKGEEIICSKQLYANLSEENQSTSTIIENQQQTKVDKEEEIDNIMVVKSEFIGIIEFTEKIINSNGKQFIEKGDVICTIEAMKLFNEIKSPKAGYILPLVENGAQVEYDKELFCVKEDEYENI